MVGVARCIFPFFYNRKCLKQLGTTIDTINRYETQWGEGATGRSLVVLAQKLNLYIMI